MENRYAKVEGHVNIVRDLKTNAIINTDFQGFKNYVSSKNKRATDKKVMNDLIDDVKNLKESIEEIKLLLKSTLNGS